MSIKDVLVGSTPAQRLYRGEALLWEKTNGYTITKIANGITETQVVAGGDCTNTISFPVENNAHFAGWYTNSSFSSSRVADFSNVTADMTVYGKYIESDKVGFDIARSGGLIGAVAFGVDVPITSNTKPDIVYAHATKGGTTVSAILDTMERINIGTKKKPIYVYHRKGNIRLNNITVQDTFTVETTWTTPDGTDVSLSSYEIEYNRGDVIIHET